MQSGHWSLGLFSDDSDSALEIWESDSEDGDDSVAGGGGVGMHCQVLTNLHYFLSYFLLFFQLCYHVSDRGIQHILNLLSSLFCYISTISGKTLQLAADFPNTLYSVKKQFNVKLLKKYCVCPSCHSIYDNIEIEEISGNTISRKCSYIEFPSHPQRAHRTKCGTELMKRVRVGNKYKLIPRMVYSIRNSLEKLAARPGFLQSCESWRNVMNTDCGFMTDGKLWNYWKAYLNVPGNLLVMLNVDWFRPFKHTTYSIGVMYLVIQNLPRAQSVV